MAEFKLIDLIRARATQARDDVVLGIGDDAALLQPPPGMQLVVAMDTLNDGVHFPPGTDPAHVGWKALAVNLSDLAAMAAEPAWCTLSLSLPDGDPAWVAGFLDGFLALASLYDVALVGGDTTRGPLSISVTVHGFVDPGRALRRDGARVGDGVWVSGTLGGAAAALGQWRAGETIAPALRERLERPRPRIALGRALAGVANACIDISDGVLADLGHVCVASGVAVRLEVDALPGREALRPHLGDDAARMLQASGGDDYELCFTAPGDADATVRAAADAAETGVEVTRVGTVVAGQGVQALDRDGRSWLPARKGHEHFVP
ncbi:thiamine-phosphate kinase [Luteimonas terricola]|uniref:Thiamine-monophosphate kinase n=1 Tax=Luteimonas terricola TaxID=645597 RepID=A0ABQ2EBX7_9GAMM|nr:thiamine-phosphate kinase [Luteimonas terricola]GGJ99277.1 thiamine-monophosphate kinase [Luteimonas terricola]